MTAPPATASSSHTAADATHRKGSAAPVLAVGAVLLALWFGLTAPSVSPVGGSPAPQQAVVTTQLPVVDQQALPDPGPGRGAARTSGPGANGGRR
jgi:hypothetical protein